MHLSLSLSLSDAVSLLYLFEYLFQVENWLIRVLVNRIAASLSTVRSSYCIQEKAREKSRNRKQLREREREKLMWMWMLGFSLFKSHQMWLLFHSQNSTQTVHCISSAATRSLMEFGPPFPPLPHSHLTRFNVHVIIRILTNGKVFSGTFHWRLSFLLVTSDETWQGERQTTTDIETHLTIVSLDTFSHFTYANGDHRHHQLAMCLPSVHNHQFHKWTNTCFSQVSTRTRKLLLQCAPSSGMTCLLERFI